MSDRVEWKAGRDGPGRIAAARQRVKDALVSSTWGLRRGTGVAEERREALRAAAESVPGRVVLAAVCLELAARVAGL